MSHIMFPVTMRQAASLLGCSTTAVRLRITSGELPGAFKARTPANRLSWYLTRSDYEQMYRFLEQPGGRRKRFKRRVRGDVVHYQCTCCQVWKLESEFLNCSKKASWGKRTQCRMCEQDKRREWRAENMERSRKTARSSYRKRRDRAKKEGGRLMYEYRTKAHIDGNAVLEQLYLAYPQSTLGEIAYAMHVELKALKNCINAKITLEKADRLLTASGRSFMLDQIAPVPGLDGWSIHSDRCVNPMCGTIEIPHGGRGYCERCYVFVRRGEEPPLRTGWSMYHPYCRRCKGTDRKHECRGLCSRCLYYVRRDGTLDQYPPSYAPINVGSGHGSVQQSTAEEVGDHGSSRNGGEGRQPGSRKRDDAPDGELAEARPALR